MYLPDVASETAPIPRFATHLRNAFARHRLLAAVAVGYAALSITLSTILGSRSDTASIIVLVMNFLKMLPVMAYFLIMWRILTMRFTVPANERQGWLKNDLKRALTDPERLASGAIAVPLMTIVILSFGHMKALIPIIQPFAWDQTFIALDRALHFGVDPWRIAHAVAGHPFVLTVVTGAYNFWMFLMYFSLIFACFSTVKRAERMQYLVAFILAWAIGGNLIATIFSSAGPAYVERLGLGDHFAPLMALLHDHAATQSLTALETQDLLWSFYTAPVSMSGISAFPSMHVASTTLMALYARSYNRRLGRVIAAFAGLIMLGSVLLAWHYAVDGYAGALVAVSSWWIAGRLVRRFGAAG